MIIREFHSTREDGVKLYLTYSDEDLCIVQNETGLEYDGAIDVENAPYTYSETNKLIERKASAADYKKALAELGVK